MKGAYEITPFYATDERGGFVKDYNIDMFKANGIEHELKEVFYTISKKGYPRNALSACEAAGKACPMHQRTCV